MPFQPEGIWETVYNGESWKLSEGEDKHRRAVYTFLKRTSPYPSFITFDAGSREVCVSKRIVTNTPLQALVTLNDPVFLQAAFHLGQKMKGYSNNDPQKAIAFGYELCTLFPISPNKMDIFHSLYKDALSEYQNNPELIAELIPEEANEKSAELAAFSVVANALLNLDEFLTKP
jgi:hypothetical protein